MSEEEKGELVNGESGSERGALDKGWEMRPKIGKASKGWEGGPGVERSPKVGKASKGGKGVQRWERRPKVGKASQGAYVVQRWESRLKGVKASIGGKLSLICISDPTRPLYLTYPAFSAQNKKLLLLSDLHCSTHT